MIRCNGCRCGKTRLYAVLPDAISREELRETAAAIREAFWRSLAHGEWELSTTFRAPRVIPRSAVRLLPMAYRGPGEHDYLRRHGVSLDGSIEDLPLK